MAVVDAVAAREGVDPVALTPPLYEAIDPDALDALFVSHSANSDHGADSIRFTYKGYTVTVASSGNVELQKDDGEP